MVLCNSRERRAFAIGSLGAVKITQAKNRARPADGPETAPARKQEHAGESTAAGNGFAFPAEGVTPLETSRRRWTVRVHWGIVFAIVASLTLWFAIKTVVELVF